MVCGGYHVNSSGWSRLGLLLVIVLCSVRVISADEVLTNQDIINLVGAKLAPDLVKRKIKSCDNDFDLSADAMVDLRTKGVPDSVISSMLQAVAKQKVKRRNRVDLQIQYLTSARKETRHAAYMRLVQMGGGARRRMREILSEKTDPVRRAAVVRALGKMGDKRSLEVLRLLIEDPNAQVRAACAEALFQIDDKILLRAVKAVDSWNPYSETAAPVDGYIRVLGLARQRQASAVVMKILEESNSAVEREAAVCALGRMVCKNAVKPLTLVLKNDGALPVRVAAAEALGILRDPESVDILIEVAKSDRAVSPAVFRAMGFFSKGKAVPFLISQIKDDNTADEKEALVAALRRLTRKDYGSDKIAWLDWWEKYEESQALESVRNPQK
jgi:HEAT repeat protein